MSPKSKHKKIMKIKKIKGYEKEQKGKSTEKSTIPIALCSLQYCGDSTNTLNCWLMSLSVSEIEFENK